MNLDLFPGDVRPSSLDGLFKSSTAQGWADWSGDGPEGSEYRYLLCRMWPLPLLPKNDGTCLFVMLNPSTATAKRWDRTVRRCAAYALDWGFRRLAVANVYALRSTDPSALGDHPDPVGPMNDEALDAASDMADLTVCAWGSHVEQVEGGEDRAAKVLSLFDEPHYLTLNAGGQPGHPLYLRKDLQPQPFKAQ